MGLFSWRHYVNDLECPIDFGRKLLFKIKQNRYLLNSDVVVLWDPWLKSWYIPYLFYNLVFSNLLDVSAFRKQKDMKWRNSFSCDVGEKLANKLSLRNKNLPEHHQAIRHFGLMSFLKVGQPQPLIHLVSSFCAGNYFSFLPDSNSDLRSRKKGCWPLDHYHGPSVECLSTKMIVVGSVVLWVNYLNAGAVPFGLSKKIVKFQTVGGQC